MTKKNPFVKMKRVQESNDGIIPCDVFDELSEEYTSERQFPQGEVGEVNESDDEDSHSIVKDQIDKLFKKIEPVHELVYPKVMFILEDGVDNPHCITRCLILDIFISKPCILLIEKLRNIEDEDHYDLV